jgi:hypothetical protein
MAPNSAAVSETEWASLTSIDLLLTLRAPVGWDIDVVDELRFRVVRNAADAGGYRASVGFVLGEPEEPGAEWFARFCAALAAEVAGSADLIDTAEFVIGGSAKVFAVRTRQPSAGAPATSELFAYAWANSNRMYGVDASTLREHEERDLPVFDQILRSIRVLPPRS